MSELIKKENNNLYNDFLNHPDRLEKYPYLRLPENQPLFNGDDVSRKKPSFLKKLYRTFFD